MSLFTREGGMAARKTLALVAALGLLIFTPVPVNAAPQAPRPVNAIATENTALTAETEEAAIALAASSGERVEVLAFRDEQREVYANPDGTLTAEEHTEPVRAMRDGRWVDIDTDLVERPDGTIAPKAAATSLTLSDGEGEEPLIQADEAGRELSLEWLGDLPEPTIDGSRAKYGEVMPGVDLVVNVTPTGFSHLLVVKSAAAAMNPELRNLDFGFQAEGVTVTTDEAGGLVATDESTGQPVFEGGTPIMWDSPEDPETAEPEPEMPVLNGPTESAQVSTVDLTLSEDKITLAPDMDLLLGTETQYPVAIDPVWTSTTRSAWAMVDSGYPTEEYWKFDNESHERIGRCPPYSYCNKSKVKRLFYTLGTPYAGKNIISAEFRVTMVHTYDSSARAVSLYRMPSGISSKTNWNNQPGGTGSWDDKVDTRSPTGKQSGCTTTNQNVGFNATTAVRNAIKENKSTTTFGIRADNESDIHFVKRFCNNAVLSVNYNRPPSTPKTSEMTTSPGGACVTGTNRPYADVSPRLYAVLRDPDHSSKHVEQVRGEFKVYWPVGAPTTNRTYPVSSFKASGNQFNVLLPNDLPQNVVIGWEVRAFDGRDWGGWSGRCEFVLDKTQPTAPDIDSPEYLPGDVADTTSDCVGDDAEQRGSIGSYGTFAFDSAATDVKEYIYGFNSNPLPDNKLTPTALGGPVSRRLMPTSDGPNFVTVQAIDQANKKSPIAICYFRVATIGAAGQWELSEPVGSSTAADSNSVGDAHPATAGSGVTFGAPGPGGRSDFAAHLDGTTHANLATSARAIVDTGKSFSVSAWVRLTDASRDAVAVSQDGSGEAGFTLGYDATSRKWAFRVPVGDVLSLGDWSVLAGPVQVNEWTHLVATYDSEIGSIALHINDGSVSASAPRRSAWTARGAVQIGRATGPSGYRDAWTGDLADVAVYRRLLVLKEARELYDLVPFRSAYWTMNTLAQNSTPEASGGPALTIGGNPVLYAPDPDDPFAQPALVGAGHLKFDGDGDYAATTGPIAATDRSFTVSARVRLAGSGCGKNMAVLSQAGTQSSGFVVRCSAANRWELSLPTEDKADPLSDEVYDDQVLPAAGSSGTHLAVVYNSFTNEVRLYVNGQLADAAQGRHDKVWQANGGFQVARAKQNGAWGQYFAGVIDDVRVYEGAADPTLVQRLAIPKEFAGI
jgi:hypothetical protein